LIWHDPQGVSDGTQGPNTAFFRKNFDLDLQDPDISVSGAATVQVDDDYELYVNGELAFENKDQGAHGPADRINIAPYLRDGENVFAIHAVDGGWGSPFDLAFEEVLFDATIDIVAVPEEIDALTSGRGADTFVLGDKDNVYHATGAENDYALITDFRREDVIQLHGRAENYALDPDFMIGESQGTGIFLKGTGSGELVGFVEGTRNLDLTSSDFWFV
jgi:hypothetical protein